MEFSDLSLQTIAFRVLALLIIAGIHGGVVAGAAVLLGDNGPRHDGRLTIVPTSHIDPIGAISLIIFGFGWVKPIEIDSRQFRVGRIGVVVVILAGFTGLIITAALLHALTVSALTMLSHTAGLTTAAFLRAAGSLSIWFALFNLIPIPPLTGGLLLEAFGMRASRQVQWILAALLLAALATGVIRQLLGPTHTVLASVVLGA